MCHCGINIGGVVKVPEVMEYAKTLPNVVYAEENLYTCSQDTQEKIKEKIKEHELNRVVVAICTPRTHEPLFQNTIREAGLNPYLFEMANIRDQCSWIHMHEPKAATKKSKDLVRMAVAKSRLLEPLENLDAEGQPAGARHRRGRVRHDRRAGAREAGRQGPPGREGEGARGQPRESCTTCRPGDDPKALPREADKEVTSNPNIKRAPRARR